MNFKKNKSFGFRAALLLLTFLWALPNMAEAQLNNFKKVNIIPVETVAPKCGKFFLYGVKFQVETNQHNGGWVIQELRYSSIRAKCPPIQDIIHITKTYYELWWVPAGATTPTPFGRVNVGGHITPPLNDNYSIDIPLNTKGEASWHGKVAFVEDANKTLIAGGAWPKGGVPEAGILRSSLLPPAFWANLVASGKLKNHNAYVKWNCCIAKPVLEYNLKDTAKKVPAPTPPDTTPDPDNEGYMDPDKCGEEEDPEDLPPSDDGEVFNSIHGHLQRAFPNPSSGMFVLDLQIAKADSKVKIVFSNLLGKQIESKVYLKIAEGRLQVDADLSTYENGWYVAAVYVNGDLIGTSKVLVQK